MGRRYLIVGRKKAPALPKEHFQLKIDTRQTSTGLNGITSTFLLPTTQPYSYDWVVDFGDGTTQRLIGTGGTAGTANTANLDGVPYTHTYSEPGEYVITITPFDKEQPGWFRAFGFGGSASSSGSGVVDNRNKMVAPLSPFTVQMFGNADGTGMYGTEGASSIGYGMFSVCCGLNFHIGESCLFVPEWDLIQAPSFFLQRMFSASSLKEVPVTFKLPSFLTTYYWNGYLYEAFQECKQLTAVNTSMPPFVSGNSVLRSTFKDCTALQSLSVEFNLNKCVWSSNSYEGNVFNSTFSGCPNLVLPAGFSLPMASQTRLNQANFMYRMFYSNLNQTWTQPSGDVSQILGSMASMTPVTSTQAFRTGADLANSQANGASRWGSGFNTLNANWQ